MEINDVRARKESAVVQRLHGAELHRFLLRMLGRADAANEIARHVYELLDAAQGITRAALRPLAFDMATRFAIEYLRAEKRNATPALEAEPSAFSAAAITAQQQKLADAQESLACVIEGMDENLRRAFVMRYVTGMPREEIATRLRISIEEVDRRLRQALAFCRKRLPDFE